ncbi:Ras-related protein Rab-32B [Holothuria leucospilota]|uniref:Ras-related protein Rab-32B n=1 Tax=Holothuria leucospilota TaxID=206669 RepID=A0A9Q1HHF9_HOLLE|nr:Ras-related protein Rab-32B [Holothuria leucospilota]
MTRVYYKYAIAAIIMFDLSRPATFDSVIKWSEDVNQKVMLANEQPIPVLLLANKCDLEDVTINDRALNEFCAEQNFLGWFSTSAKDNVNIDEAMHFLVENILQLNNQNIQPDADHISLHQDREYFEIIDEGKTPLSKLKDQCCR